MPRDEATLLDIAKAARLMLAFVEGIGKESFLQDAKTQSAVLHQLLVMGEAVKRLSTDCRSRFPAIPWSLVAGTRDHLIHGYDAVDLEEVWKTVARDVPALLEAIKPAIPNSGRDDR
jgi:uncharacterized protein with HEPN domain